MTVYAHPTETDYKHALAAHTIWVRIARQSGGWRRRAIILLVLPIYGILTILALSGELVSTREWTVNAVSLVASMSYFPVVIILAALQIMFRSSDASRPKSVGLIEQAITSRGAAKGVSSRRVIRWTVFYVTLIAGVAVATFLSVVGGWPGAPSPPVAPTAAPTPISGGAIFVGVTLISFGAAMLLAKAQKVRAAKHLVTGTPSLLLPRTWEFTEEVIVERSDLVQTTMKWEYLHKFLETQMLIMLYPNEQSFYLIPKSAFTNELELAGFMGLLMRKVPNGVMQPRGGRGFMVQPVAAIPLSG
jgi:hypothetical protein